jgi:hypothetical protein
MRRLAPLVSLEIVREVCQAEDTIKAAADDFQKAHESWRTEYDARVRQNNENRATMLGRLIYREQAPSTVESVLGTAMEEKRLACNEAAGKIDEIISRYLAPRDSTFKREIDEVKFLSGRDAPQDFAAGIALGSYMNSVAGHIKVFRELCLQKREQI